ncbi:peptidase S8/S53 domain-containing protein [Earliella scabrosa]|nr:peptidase S8/S53 domain-containing protein [Earliella scabrosa]
MRFLIVLATALASAATVGAAPSRNLKPILRHAGEIIPRTFIVKLKDGASKEAHFGWVSSKLASVVNITHPDWSPRVLNGYSGTLSSLALDRLRARDEVEFIEEVGVVKTTAIVTQTNATWGLQRISQAARLPPGSNPSNLNFTFVHDSASGTGVDVYVLDTGCNVAHPDFGGRAIEGPIFACELQNPLAGLPILGGAGLPILAAPCVQPSGPGDQNGHGSHTAGTVGSNTFGVAKNVSIIAVKVLNSVGVGDDSNIISGLDFVVTNAMATGRPSIVSMSLGGDVSQALDSAVANTIAAGIHTVVAAGNGAANAANSSPARVPEAVTVGSSNINDARSSFSNFGPIVDIFGPGENVISTSNMGDGVRTLTGTSMATPHVAGIIASIISAEGNSSPADMIAKLTARAISVLDNDSDGTFADGTPNKLAQLNPSSS